MSSAVTTKRKVRSVSSVIKLSSGQYRVAQQLLLAEPKKNC